MRGESVTESDLPLHESTARKNDTEAWEVYSALKTRTNPFNFPGTSGEFYT